jgi:hypothetical protein
MQEMKKKLISMTIVFGLMAIPTIAGAAQYQLRLQSSEALDGYISLRYYRTKAACVRALKAYLKENPGRTLECIKVR